MGSSGDCFAEEDSDMSDTEKLGFKVVALAALTEGKITVQNPDWTTYACPFCPKRKKQDYLHKDLLQHAAGVGSSVSNKRSAREKGEHSALAKYLRRNPPPETFLKEQPLEARPRFDGTDWRSKLPLGDLSERIVWPWIGVVVNIPTRVGEDGRYAGESGSKLRDELTERGFNPTRVRPLWSFRGHSGTAVVEFTKGWPGLSNGLSFERAYEADGHGKKDWAGAKGEERSGLYAWLARGDDYQLPNIVGEHLRKIGDLKTISEIMEEEAMKQDRLVSDLTNTIDEKNRHMEEIRLMFKETTKSIDSLIDANKQLNDKYDQDIKKLQSSSLDHYHRVFSGFEKLKSQLESQKRELELRGHDLEKREAVNDIERKKLAEDIAENIEKNSSLEMASLAQSHADDRVLKLAEDQERQKQELHNKILSLREQLEKRQAIELEIEQLKGKLNVTKQMAMGDDDLEILGKVEEIHRELREKEGEFDNVESINQALIIKERKCNDELQEARKELIQGLKDMSQRGSIGVKRLGELDSQPFIELMKRKYSEDEADDRAMELCSVWEEHLKDPDWHPFMRVTVGNKDMEIVNPDDEKLSDLKKELGEEVYKSVTNCLIEINEHNPSGRYITSELWNYKERKRAPFKDGIEVMLSYWRQKKARFEGE